MLKYVKKSSIFESNPTFDSPKQERAPLGTDPFTVCSCVQESRHKIECFEGPVLPVDAVEGRVLLWTVLSTKRQIYDA